MTSIQSRVTGDVIDIDDEGARTLIDAGIYDAAPTKEPPKAPTPKSPPQKTPDRPTKVEPMTTEDMPAPTKKVKVK